MASIPIASVVTQLDVIANILARRGFRTDQCNRHRCADKLLANPFFNFTVSFFLTSSRAAASRKPAVSRSSSSLLQQGRVGPAKRKGRAGTFAARLGESHDGCLCPSSNTGKTQSAGKSGGHAAPGGSENGMKKVVSPAKNAVSSKPFGLLASPTGFEPVLPP